MVATAAVAQLISDLQAMVPAITNAVDSEGQKFHTIFLELEHTTSAAVV